MREPLTDPARADFQQQYERLQAEEERIRRNLKIEPLNASARRLAEEDRWKLHLVVLARYSRWRSLAMDREAREAQDVRP